MEARVSGDSMMEFEVPGDEKKNLSEAKSEAKSGGSSEEWEVVKLEVLVGVDGGCDR
uniref:Uncharacterized protein n=1 Tax=Arachis hypogaea TaxID=3818 RepID=N1NEY9_ARAHY|nr:hypothetical protein ARAX_AHF417E07-005 [Arachis hypogaea]